MKKFAAILLTMTLLLTMFSGCTEGSSVEEDSSIDSSIQEEEKIIGRYIDDSILQIECVEFGEENVQIADTAIIDEHYLLCSWSSSDLTESGLRAYDLYTGQRIWDYELPNGAFYTLNAYDDGSFDAYSYASEYLYFPELKDEYPDTISFPKVDYNDPDAPITYDAYSFYAPNKYVHTVESKIYLGAYATREKLLCDLSDYYEDYINFCYESDGSFYFTSMNKYTWKNDLFLVHPDGTFKYLNENTTGSPMLADKKIYNWGYNEGIVNVRFKDGMFYDLKISCDTSNESLMFVNDNRFTTLDYYTTSENMSLLRVYSSEDASLLYKTDAFSECGWLFTGEFVDDKHMFLTFSESVEASNGEYYQEYSFFFVDFSAQEPLKREKPVGTDLSVPLELEAALEREYSIEIFTKSEAIIEFPDFYAAELNNVATITSTLESIQWVMEKFPVGFFQELYSEDNKIGPTQLNIYITSTLTPTNNSGTSYPAAYAYYDYQSNAQVIVLDGTQSYTLKTNFAHELMHAIETYINNHTDYDTLFGFDKWYEYLPEEFEYNGSYRGEDGFDYSNFDYTIYGEDSENIYFIDQYSKTFSLEDRARLFENLFVENSFGANENSTVFVHKYIRERAEYLCSVIREYFDSVQNSENIWWERLLH